MGMSDSGKTFTAFWGDSVIGSGELKSILHCLRSAFERDPGAAVLTFSDQTGEQVDFDLRGSVAEVLERAAGTDSRPGPGRPKLGVVSREVSLLPRHWEWLQEQPNGASAAIRRLIDDERRRDPEALTRRMAMKSAGRFMSAMAGSLPGYEEATRALYRGDRDGFRDSTSKWPADIRTYAEHLALPAFASE